MAKWTNDQIGRALLKLWKFKPQARDIRVDVCHCRQRGVMLSYLLPDTGGPDPRDPGNESCGYFCGSCDFGNAGYRGMALSFDDIERLMAGAEEDAGELSAG